MSDPDAPVDDHARTEDGYRRPTPFGAPYVYVLVVVEGEDIASAHRIVRPETLVGRGEENHLAIPDDEVSKVHCRIRVDGPVCTILDSNSRNGTKVNGRPVPPKVALRLRNLDEIEIGSHRILVLSGRSRARTRSAA